MHRRQTFPVYRALIKLYPKPYRQEYGEQMVQTLADMLEDHHGRSQRAAVWIRVGSELPLSIVQENMNNIGATTMNKLTKLSNKQLLKGGGVLAVLILLLAATWGRGFIASNGAKVFYLKPLQRMIAERDAELNNPFHAFGSGPLEKASFCGVTAATFISTQVECSASAHGTMKLSDNKGETVEKAQALEANLKRQGYKAGSNGVTFTSLVAGTYQGKDYSPDAFYQKIDGPYMCVFDTTIAYSNPAPKAISMNLSCRRTLEILGTPSNAGY